ncbi:agrin [Nematostella vectensis]|uniref:agrin n=1 Tax=Nematostella vectensis TaxID=45351 RepID=UPI00207765C1|nr:agrin [Nematostella vectensis]
MITVIALVADVCSKVTCHRYAKCNNHYNGTASCSCSSRCPLVYKPVCGTDMETHINACLLKLKSCQIESDLDVAYSGPCLPDPCLAKRCPPYAQCVPDHVLKARCTCPERCPLTYNLICGSDGVSYLSACAMRATACQQNRNITVAHHGACERVSCGNIRCPRFSVCISAQEGGIKCSCPIYCPPSGQPVCGSDGKSYGSECELRKEACEAKIKLTLVSKGKCYGMKYAPYSASFTISLHVST